MMKTSLLSPRGGVQQQVRRVYYFDHHSSEGFENRLFIRGPIVAVFDGADSMDQPETDLEQFSMAQLDKTEAGPDANNLVGREVARELNNVLTIIQACADQIAMKSGTDEDLQRKIQMINRNVRRAAVLIYEATPDRQAQLLPPSSPPFAA